MIFNNDLAFTAINMISHGVPCVALTWIYRRNQAKWLPPRPGALFRYAG